MTKTKNKTMSYHVYGIKNCNTVKKALAWLDARQIPYVFHDYKKEGLSAARLESWIAQTGWEALLNKRGTTWRKLDKTRQEKITGAEAAQQLMLENTSIIRRPLIEQDGKVKVLGFEENEYLTTFNDHL